MEEHKESPPPYGVNAPPLEPHHQSKYPPQYPQQPQYPQYPQHPQYGQPPQHPQYGQPPQHPQYAPPPPHTGPVYYAPPTPQQQTVINQGAPVVNVVNNTGGVCHVPGSCPVCHGGTFESSVTCCGICCCIFFFPLGLICLFCMMEKKCSHCGYTP